MARPARSALPVHRSSEEKRGLGQVDFTRKWWVDLGLEYAVVWRDRHRREPRRMYNNRKTLDQGQRVRTGNYMKDGSGHK